MRVGVPPGEIGRLGEAAESLLVEYWPLTEVGLELFFEGINPIGESREGEDED